MSGYRHCITEESADRQRQFENALLELMGQKDLHKISIQEVCDRVGLSRKTFYRYFSSREECLNALVDHAILDYTQVSLHSDHMQTTLERFYTYWKSQAVLLDALYYSELGNLLFERAMLCASEEYGIRSCFLQDNGSYEHTIFFISGIFGVLMNWYTEGFQRSPAQIANSLSQLLLDHSHGVY